MIDLPGNLIPCKKNEWLDLVLRSEQPHDVKLAGYVLYRTAKYNKKHQITMTDCSAYTVSLILKTNSNEAKERIDSLINNGWLWDTGIKIGARYAHALTINVEPQRMKH